MCVAISASLPTCAGANGLCPISASSLQRMRCEGNGLLGNIAQEATFILLQTKRKKQLSCCKKSNLVLSPSHRLSSVQEPLAVPKMAGTHPVISHPEDILIGRKHLLFCVSVTFRYPMHRSWTWLNLVAIHPLQFKSSFTN